MDKELNYLYALIALRLGNASPKRMRELFDAWQKDPERALPTRAAESGAVTPEHSAFLVALVKQAVQSANGSAGVALQRLGGEGAMRNALAGKDGASVDRLGQWALPLVIASAAIAFLSVVIMGSGWYSATSDRITMQGDTNRMQDQYTLLSNEVTHLKRLNEVAETDRQRALSALALAEEDLTKERRARREAEALVGDNPLPPPPLPEAEQQAGVPNFQWQPQEGARTPQRPVALNLKQLEQQTQGMDPTRALAQLNPQFPTDANGRVLGVSSNNFSSMPLARQFGLQNGDIISNINGVNITGISSYAAIANAVQGGGPVQVTIMRNGQPMTATFSVR